MKNDGANLLAIFRKDVFGKLLDEYNEREMDFPFNHALEFIGETVFMWCMGITPFNGREYARFPKKCMSYSDVVFDLDKKEFLKDRHGEDIYGLTRE